MIVLRASAQALTGSDYVLVPLRLPSVTSRQALWPGSQYKVN